MQISLEATIDNLDTVTEFVNEQLEAMGCSPRSMLQIDVAIDEIFTNVCSYAYGDAVGSATLSVERIDNDAAVSITVEDAGVPFNPLSAQEPDVTLGLEERPIGGLGIFMVRQSMDDVRYEFVDGHNRLTLVKAL